MERAEIIRNAYKAAGMNSDRAICRETGFQYDRFHGHRMQDIGSMTLREFWLLQRHAFFEDEEVLEIARDGPPRKPRKKTGGSVIGASLPVAFVCGI